ncbi:MAG: DUF1343 domain-containing protein [Myxococcota bacterium]|nr:DUF1343 domain-containing protein [Myxococcota bacterium]
MKIGLERLLEKPHPHLGSGRVGLIANPTAIDHSLEHAIDLMHGHPEINLTKLFGPEHGIRATAQDMLGVGHSQDPKTGLTEVSLYGSTFASLTPTDEDLSDLDILVFDIQDVGSRYYTYAATMALAMQACAKNNLKMVVLDRPNPIGGSQVEGGGLTPGYENFCALYPVPQRHGMTVGELAQLYNESFGIGCELDVITCEGWSRKDYYDQTDLPWVMPSPNMPTLDTAIVYPGTCLLEGTKLSEARGTTRPFELLGAPYIDGHALRDKLNPLDLPGIGFRPVHFEPTFHKFAGQDCGGIQLHVRDRQAFEPYKTGLAVIWAIKQLYPDQFQWREDTYEFRSDVPAIDLLTGFVNVREAIDAGEPFSTVTERALRETAQYDAGRDSALLYD